MIKSDQYITDEVRKAAESEALANLMNAFSEAMFAKIVSKMQQGYSGWDKKDPIMIELLKNRLADNVNHGDWIDVANVSMFLWNMQHNRTSRLMKYLIHHHKNKLNIQFISKVSTIPNTIITI